MPRRASEERPPVILQVLPRFESGGVERGTLEIAGAIAAAGWGSLVVSSGGRLEPQLARVGGHHIRLPVESKNPFVVHANAGRLARLIEQRGIDILHARSRAPAWSACLAARRTGCHFMTTFHGTYLGGAAPKRYYNSVMARGERIIVASEFIREHVLERYQAEADCLRLIPRGVDIDRFDPEKISQERIATLAAAWRLPDGAPVAMLPGRLTSWKGQEVMIEALARLGRDDVCCVLVGAERRHGGARERLERLFERHGHAGHLRIVGDCVDMPAAYMLADVVVSASTKPESFGRTIVEAQAMGRPVIATDHGGARETVIPRVTGWLVPPNSVDALALRLAITLALGAEARAALAARAIAHVRANYTLAAMCARTLAVYRELLDAPTPRAVASAAA